MQTLFSPDSKFMMAMSRIGDLLLLNFFFLLTCVPIVTIGAATTALYTVVFRFGTEREQGLVKSYFIAFRDNFKQATCLWLLALLCGGSAGFNTLLFYAQSGGFHNLYILFAVLFVLVLFVAGYAFPLLSQFNSGNMQILKNALILSIAYFPRSILIVVINIFPWALLVLNFYLFLQAGFLWVMLYFSAAAYLNSVLLKKVFDPYMKTEEMQ